MRKANKDKDAIIEKLVKDGKSYREIAVILNISPSTAMRAFRRVRKSYPPGVLR